VKRSDKLINKVLKDGLVQSNPDYQDESCLNEVPEIGFEKAMELNDAIFIDIREAYENPKLDLSGLKQIPMGQIESEIDKFKSPRPKIVLCETGIRSKTAVAFLEQRGVTNCYSLRGGIKAINNLNAYIL
ncbi:MAG: rhodanese-like domain-containing protein, partial [Bacteroidia bacterium]|nr:rhodanese-like domain-containing protein [Bacteroidia bacterium]